MKTNQISCSKILLIVLAVIVCLVVAGGALAAVTLPAQAEQDFGPAASRLTGFEKYWVSFRLYWNMDDVIKPASTNPEPKPFRIELGDPVNVIAARLEREGLVRNGEVFQLFLIYSGLDTSIQAGDYLLSTGMNVMDIARAMQDATPAEVKFVILPGWRSEEIADALATSGVSVSKDEFLHFVTRAERVEFPEGLEIPSNGRLDGYLLPGEYQIPRKVSPPEFIKFFLERFAQEVNSDLRSGFERQALSLEEAVTLASIVQREAVVDDEQPMVASVFINRIRGGMKLDSDPTVQYALGYNEQQKSWWTNPLSSQDLTINSPFNTYQVMGLPPNPISNPGINALKSVAYPAETPYYYFRAACDGSGRHLFAITYEEHLSNACP